MNTLESIENGAFLKKSKCSIYHDIFKYIIFKGVKKHFYCQSKGLMKIIQEIRRVHKSFTDRLTHRCADRLTDKGHSYIPHPLNGRG